MLHVRTCYSCGDTFTPTNSIFERNCEKCMKDLPIDTNTGNNEAGKMDFKSPITKPAPNDESIEYALSNLKRLGGIFEFIDKVETMMDQQQRFFKTRSREDLSESKRLEKEVRELIRKLKAPQKELF
jgi:hypothetical protein